MSPVYGAFALVSVFPHAAVRRRGGSSTIKEDSRPPNRSQDGP